MELDHSILLSVLHSGFGVTDVALDWFVSYLSDRTQSSVRMGTERRFGPFKTTRLMVKFHQAHVIAIARALLDKAFQTKNAPNVVWRPGRPDPLGKLTALSLLKTL